MVEADIEILVEKFDLFVPEIRGVHKTQSGTMTTRRIVPFEFSQAIKTLTSRYYDLGLGLGRGMLLSKWVAMPLHRRVYYALFPKKIKMILPAPRERI